MSVVKNMQENNILGPREYILLKLTTTHIILIPSDSIFVSQIRKYHKYFKLYKIESFD